MSELCTRIEPYAKPCNQEKIMKLVLHVCFISILTVFILPSAVYSATQIPGKSMLFLTESVEQKKNFSVQGFVKSKQFIYLTIAKLQTFE